MSIASASQPPASTVHWLMLGEEAPPGWTEQAEDLLEKALRGDIFRRTFLTPEPIATRDLPYNRLMLTQCREYQDVRYSMSGDRITGLLITRTPGQAASIPEDHYQDETDYYMDQYGRQAAKLSDALDILDKNIVPVTLKSEDARTYEESSDILCLAVDPATTEDIGVLLLGDLPQDQDYKVCVVEKPGSDATKVASDPNNAAYYSSRGFSRLTSLPLSVPETHWEKGGKHDAIWLLRPRREVQG